MNLPTRLLPLLLCTLPAIGQDRLVRETEALSPDQELAAFTLAEGFEVRLLAATAPVDLRDRLRPYLPPPPPAPPLALPPAERERLSRLVADRIAAHDPAAADPGKGKTLFATHCAACHRLGGEGGLVGPQLDGIGTRGLGRLAEDILDPNRNVDAHFRLTRITLRDGTLLGGFVAGESGEVLHLLDPAGQSHRLRLADIANRETTALSLMPSAFGELLRPEEFRDLAAWLLGRK
jgi:putative heme-binding domain-containing protein